MHLLILVPCYHQEEERVNEAATNKERVEDSEYSTEGSLTDFNSEDFNEEEQDFGRLYITLDTL